MGGRRGSAEQRTPEGHEREGPLEGLRLGAEDGYCKPLVYMCSGCGLVYAERNGCRRALSVRRSGVGDLIVVSCVSVLFVDLVLVSLGSWGIAIISMKRYEGKEEIRKRTFFRGLSVVRIDREQTGWK